MNGKAPSAKLQKPLLSGIGVLVAGIVVAAAGSSLCGTWAKYTLQNYVGFGVLSTGVILLVAGFFLAAEGGFKTMLAREERMSPWLPPRFKEISPLTLFDNVHALACGVALTIVGSMTAGNWAKFSIQNYLGYGLLLTGVGCLVVGAAGIAAAYILGTKRASLFNSVLSVVAGAAMFLIGSATAAEWANNTSPNYVGFGAMLLGMFILSFGAFGVINSLIKERIVKIRLQKPLMVQERALFGSLWIIAFAVAASVVGLTIADVWATASILNYIGYAILLLGIVTLVTGHAGIVTAYAIPRFASSHARRQLIGSLETNDLDTIADPAARGFISETQTKLLVLLETEDEVALADLAGSLGLSLNLTKKFLQRCLRQKNINGYLTLDGERYFSAKAFRKNLEALIIKS